MSKRRKILLLLAGLVLAFVAYMMLTRESEPSYKGRKLSYWVDQLPTGNARVKKAANPDAWGAILKNREKAVPCFLRWMDHETPAWKTRLIELGWVEGVFMGG
jgi:hypothetical protein